MIHQRKYELANIGLRDIFKIKSLPPLQLAEQELRIKSDQQKKKSESVEKLRLDWNAPKRCVEFHNSAQFSYVGRWGEMLRQLGPTLGKGFLTALIGPQGPGKTQLAYEMMRTSTENLRSARYILAAELFLELREPAQARNGVSEKMILEKYRRPSFLVIDEMGKRGQSQWENTTLCTLLDQRHRDMSDTLLISNDSEKEFQATLDASIKRRMSATGSIKVASWTAFGK